MIWYFPMDSMAAIIRAAPRGGFLAGGEERFERPARLGADAIELQRFLGCPLRPTALADLVAEAVLGAGEPGAGYGDRGRGPQLRGDVQHLLPVAAGLVGVAQRKVD